MTKGGCSVHGRHRRFPGYARLADELIERATKDQLADVARLLALNIGWYQQPFRYGHMVTPCAYR